MDRISGLSDELLLKILLLVPTKVAVSTSILSKRWEYLWMWLPKLDYGQFDFSESEWERLRCFLDRNMPLHRAPVIESFRLELSSCSCFKPKNINMWVLTALSHSLRELEIMYELYADNPCILPSNLFTCKSLVVLKLDGEFLLDVPRMVSLPSLKTLKLQCVRFINNEQTLQRLLSNCPILEDLMVDLHDGDIMRKFTIVVPSLERLTLLIPCDHHIDGYVIQTPALKCFKLEDYCRDDHYCLIENMPCLIEAYVACCFPDINNLIGSIASVKRLEICSKAILDGLVFNELEHLEVCRCTVLCSNQLVRLLKASSKLKRLDISLADGHDPHQNLDDWNEPSTVPECLLSSLQTLNWSEYTGEPQEREIAVYILKHARHLKTATIKSGYLAVGKHEMLKELALSSRASTTCQLMFD
ncbi:hypothetical protein Bca4012_021417 [Brassica carinata]